MNDKCQLCGEELRGRIDKKFCSDQCRATAHNQNKKVAEKAVYHNN